MTIKENKMFKNDGEYIYINSPFAEVYIPENIIGDPLKSSSAVAYEYGSGMKLMGIANIKFFDSPDYEIKRGNVLEAKTFIYPTIIETFPTYMETETLTINGITDKYRVLKYEQGDVMMAAYAIAEPLSCQFFLRMILSGKIPNTVKYDQILNIWETNYNVNDASSQVPSINLQVILSEMYRYKSNPALQFRKIAGKSVDYDKDDYISCNMNEVSSFTSVMSSLTFERLTDKITSSLLLSKNNEKSQTKSPLEKVFLY